MEYAGEKTVIKIELKKDVSEWFDGSKGEKEFTFSAAPGYEMTFSEADLSQPRSANSDNNRGEKLFDYKGMYLKWGFKRIGVLSTDKYMDRGETVRLKI